MIGQRERGGSHFFFFEIHNQLFNFRNSDTREIKVMRTRDPRFTDIAPKVYHTVCDPSKVGTSRIIPVCFQSYANHQRVHAIKDLRDLGNGRMVSDSLFYESKTEYTQDVNVVRGLLTLYCRYISSLPSAPFLLSFLFSSFPACLPACFICLLSCTLTCLIPF